MSFDEFLKSLVPIKIKLLSVYSKFGDMEFRNNVKIIGFPLVKENQNLINVLNILQDFVFQKTGYVFWQGITEIATQFQKEMNSTSILYPDIHSIITSYAFLPGPENYKFSKYPPIVTLRINEIIEQSASEWDISFKLKSLKKISGNLVKPVFSLRNRYLRSCLIRTSHDILEYL